MDEGNEHPIHMTDAYSTLIAKIDALERHFTSITLVKPASTATDGSQSVMFGASPAIPTQILTTTLQPTLVTSTKFGSTGYVNDPMEHYAPHAYSASLS